MANIVIFGGGAAALSAAYHLLQAEYSVTVVMADKYFNVRTDGARFLHTGHSDSFDAFDALVHSGGFSPIETYLGGGVVECTDAGVQEYSWETLISNPELTDRLTHLYADTTGRSWSPTILNNVLGMTEPPKGLISPTYKELIDFMTEAVGGSSLCTIRSGFVQSISLAEQSIRMDEGDSVDYDLLVNTVPFWAFKDLLEVHLPVLGEFKYSAPRYCQVSADPSGNFAMTYYAGKDIDRLMGGPLKRISCIAGSRISEFFERPTDGRSLVQLPPNIEDMPEKIWADVLQHLATHNVRLLGRFAEMRSKMMFTDIIDSSCSLVESLKEEL